MDKIVEFLRVILALVGMVLFLFIIMFIISIPALPFLAGKYVMLTCNRLEINYVKCQQQRFHLYGLWSEPVTPPLRVNGAAIKEYEIKSDEGTSTGYKLYLNSGNESEELYDYEDDGNRALNAKKTINSFILSDKKLSQIRIDKSLWSEIYWIFVGACTVILIVAGLLTVKSNIKTWVNQIARRKRF